MIDFTISSVVHNFGNIHIGKYSYLKFSFRLIFIYLTFSTVSILVKKYFIIL